MDEVRIRGFENTNNRTVVLCDEVTSSSVANVKKEFLDIICKDYEIYNENVKQLRTISNEVAEAYINTVEFPPINFEINSVGGTVYDGLGLYDYVKDICGSSIKNAIKAAKNTKTLFNAFENGWKGASLDNFEYNYSQAILKLEKTLTKAYAALVKQIAAVTDAMVDQDINMVKRV